MIKEKKDNSFVRLSARYVSGVLMLGAVTAGLFWAAGRWDWWQGWAFLGFFSIYINALSIWLAKTNPDLYAERSRIAENIEPWDHWVIRFYNASLIALILIGALDSGRWRWSSVTIWAQALGWIGLCLAAVLIWHVLAVNNFSSSWVRIQDDRNQRSSPMEPIAGFGTQCTWVLQCPRSVFRLFLRRTGHSSQEPV